MGLGMRQPETAEHMGELVLERRPGGEHDAGEPRGNEAFGARFAVFAIGDDAWQMRGEAARRIGRQRLEERRAVRHPQPLDAMGDGIHCAGRAYRSGQAQWSDRDRR